MINVFKVEITALDPGFGYNLSGLLVVNDVRTRIEEHYQTEPEVAARIATGWSVWAGQVDSE